MNSKIFFPPLQSSYGIAWFHDVQIVTHLSNTYTVKKVKYLFIVTAQ